MKATIGATLLTVTLNVLLVVSLPSLTLTVTV